MGVKEGFKNIPLISPLFALLVKVRVYLRKDFGTHRPKVCGLFFSNVLTSPIYEMLLSKIQGCVKLISRKVYLSENSVGDIVS